MSVVAALVVAFATVLAARGCEEWRFRRLNDTGTPLDPPVKGAPGG